MRYNYSLDTLLNKLSQVSYLSRYLILMSDIFLSLFSSVLIYYFIDFLLMIKPDDYNVQLIVCVSLLSSIICVFLFDTYKHIIRHSTVGELMNIEYAMSLKALILVASLYVFSAIPSHLIMGYVLIDFIFSSFLLIMIRSLVTYLYYKLLYINKINTTIPVCVFSISEVSISLINYLINSESKYLPVGFITRTSHNDGMRITGLPVFAYDNENIAGVLKSLNIQSILFTNITELHSDQALIKSCIDSNIKLQMAPIVEENKSDFYQFRINNIRIEDLLERSEINININEISATFINKVVFITGAAGSIGSEICRQIAKFPIKQMVLFDNAETPMHNISLELKEKYPLLNFIPIIGDVRNISKVESQLAYYHPDIVFHAAAYKHVPLMENDPCEAIIANVGGTCNMAEMAVKYQVEKFVMISTDKAVNPSNVMGASKRIAEMYVQSLSRAIRKNSIAGRTKFVTTRFGNVLGSNGSVIPLFRSQLIKGGPLTVTHPNIIRYFMTIPEACQLVMEAASMGNGEEIFVFDMGKPVKIANLAKHMIKQAGYLPDVDIKIKYTGLRPGEKLYEELLTNTEKTLPTKNGKIRIACAREYFYNDVKVKVKHLISTACEGDKMETVRFMKSIIPEYKSMNSVYANLDVKSNFN